MKTQKLIFVLAIMASFAAPAATLVSGDEAANYQKVSDVTIDQSGLPTIGHKELSQAADKACAENGNIAQAQCYYRIVAANGPETNHKSINIEVYTK